MATIMRETGLTPTQLASDRADAIRVQRLDADTKFTCDDCGLRNLCDLAFDAYNQHGDCLAEK